jgi:DNA-binding NarL/FixJ family response regulator
MGSSPRAATTGPPFRVLIVEDHAVIRGVIRLACENAFGLEVVGEVESGEEALELCAATRPDVIALDLALPGPLQGLDVARRLRAEDHPARILVLTGSTDHHTLFESIRAGVDGYLEKTAGVRFVADALFRVAHGERIFNRDQERVAVAELGRLARQAREVSGAQSTLTEREIETLRLVARGLTVKQVGSRLHRSPRTVESHLSTLYRKLGARNRVQALARAAALGLVDFREGEIGVAAGGSVPAATGR